MYIYRHRPASWNLIGEKINWETAWNRRAALHTSAPRPAGAAGDGCLSLVSGAQPRTLGCPPPVLDAQPWCWVPSPAPQGAQLWSWVPRSLGAWVLGCPGSQHWVLCSSRRLQLALGCGKFGGVASSGCRGVTAGEAAARLASLCVGGGWHKGSLPAQQGLGGTSVPQSS